MVSKTSRSRLPGNSSAAVDAASAHVPTVEEHLGLIWSVAASYREKGLDYEELVDEGYFGLLEAIKRFDPARGARFSTYATWWIKQAILAALRERRRMIRLPGYVWDDLNQLARTRRDFWQEFQRDPTVDELAEALHCARSHVVALLTAQREITSLDQPVEVRSSQEGEDDEVIDLLMASDQTMTEREQQADVAGLLKYLSREEQRVILSRYQLGESRYGIEEIPLPFTVVGRQLGITAERVKSIEARALLKMRYWSERPHLRKREQI